MKCLKAKVKTADYDKGHIIRVSNDEATALVRETGRWEYCPKHEWKEQRDATD